MSYCFNPTCENPQNSPEAEFCQSCNSPLLLTPPPTTATTNQSRYRTLKLIGQGGFGRTFLAVDEEHPLKQVCVIKQFFPKNTNYYQHSPQNLETTSGSGGLQVKAIAQKASELFQQEAHQLETLGIHPQIPQLLTHFQQDGQQYLVQEYIEGKNLAQELAEKGAFTETKIREMLTNLLPVLQFVHQSKVIHRDIKPENIIRRRTTGQLVLVDFGAAKLVHNSGLPQTGTIIGSAAYTAPEQLMGKAVFASDIYSLGVTCIHLLTQVPPFDLFDSRDSKWVWRDYLKTPVSGEIGRILDKMLDGATNRRYHSATAIIRHLNPQSTHMETVYFSASAVPNKLTQQAEIRQKLQEALASKSVKVQVSRVNNKLTIVISRNAENRVNYTQILKIITAKLTDLRLQNIDQVKLLGKLQGKTVPEWQQILRMNHKARWKNEIVRFKKTEHFMKLSELATRDFWLAKFQEREFWLDALMFALAWFIFGYRIIIWHPQMAWIIASAFIAVKGRISRQNSLATNNLFATVATVFLIVGLLEGRFWISDVFGLLLGCLFVALPIFYIRE